MLQKIKRSVSFVMVFALLLVSGSVAASASSIVACNSEIVAESQNAIYSIQADRASKQLTEELSVCNVPVNDESLIQIVPVGESGGNAVVTTTTENAVVTKSVLMAVNEDGEIVAVSAASLSGDSAPVYPFGNSFRIVFMISYYAYSYGSDAEGLVQPQTGMFIYYDNDDLYTVKNLTMEYFCNGIDGTYIDGVFTPISQGYSPISYVIRKAVTNPSRNTYYSRTSPYNANKAIQLHYDPGGMQGVEFDLSVVRKSDGKSISISNSIDF